MLPTKGFRQKWKSGEASELRTMVRSVRDQFGWVTCANPNAANAAGLLNRVVTNLIDSLTNDDIHLTSEAGSVLSYAENVVYLAVCDGDNEGQALEAWNPSDTDTPVTLRRCDWRQRSWPFWRASLAAVCLHQLRAELNPWCSQVQDANHHTMPKTCLALAQLWELLLPSEELWPTESSSAPYWVPPPCVPTKESRGKLFARKELNWDGSNTDSLPHAVRLLISLNQLCPRSYGVWFPTVPVPNETGSTTTPGCVLKATVDLYRRPTNRDAEAEFHSPVSLPNQSVSVAPWSLVVITAATHRNLDELLPHIRHGVDTEMDQRAEEDHVMLELSPVTGSPVLTPALHGIRIPVAVDGPSLTVSLTLALWAAAESMVLYPIVATGEVTRSSIRDVGHVRGKLEAMADVLQREPGLRVLLTASDFDDPANSITDITSLGTGLRKGRFANRLDVYCLPATVQRLKELKHPLLTDGFDDLRKFMKQSGRAEALTLAFSSTNVDGPGVYLKEDRDELDQAVASASVEAAQLAFRTGTGVDATTDFKFVTVIPFDNDSRPAMRHVTAKLFTKAGERPEQPVPVPLCLETLGGNGSGKLGTRDTWLDAILQGFHDLQGNGELMMAQHPDVLRTLLRSPDWSKFCFVAYAPNSQRCDFEQQKRAIGRLREEALRRCKGDHKGMLPALLLIASDDHHARLFNAEWTNKA